MCQNTLNVIRWYEMKYFCISAAQTHKSRMQKPEHSVHEWFGVCTLNLFVFHAEQMCFPLIENTAHSFSRGNEATLLLAVELFVEILNFF